MCQLQLDELYAVLREVKDGDLSEADAIKRQHDLRRQPFVSLDAAARNRLAHRLLDLALRGDADLLQEFSQARIEHVFVHEKPPAGA